MSDSDGWLILMGIREIYPGIPTLPIPIRAPAMERALAEGGRLPPELLARELWDYLEENPDLYEKYQQLLAELTLSLGTDLAKSGEAEEAAVWLERSALANPEDLRAFGNLAKALLECDRPEEALEICRYVRGRPLDPNMEMWFRSVSAECRLAIADRDSAEPY